MCFDLLGEDLSGFLSDVIKIKDEFDFVVVALDARTGEALKATVLHYKASLTSSWLLL